MNATATVSAQAPPSPAYTSTDIMLIDLSSLAHPLWHVSQSDPDPNATSIKIVERVRALASGQPHVAVCVDMGRSFRKDLDPSYKAQRPASDATLQHQIALARETLAGDGFPVWAAPGFEADDLIASATATALATPDLSVLIVSADKDLLQLVGPRVSVKSLTTGAVIDAAAVEAKFKVTPAQMRDFLTLVGDASDNVAGCPGVGAVIASRLLQEFGTLDALYAAFDTGVVPTITPVLRTKLQHFREQMPRTRALIALRTDAPIPFDELGRDRVPADSQAVEIDGEEIVENPEPPPTHPPPTVPPPTVPPPAPTLVRRPDVMPAEWNMQLEPRSINEAVQLANAMFKSRLFSQFGTPEAVLSTVLAGREFGMQAMASLRAFHVIEGKPTLSAGAIQALVIKSGKATYFRCVERSAAGATFETQRGDDPAIRLTYTIEEGRLAFGKDDLAWNKSGWGKNPADMCVARAATKLARLVYPDVVLGIYAREEFDS